MADPTACAVTPAPSRPDLPIDAACETCGHYMYGGHRGHACDICRSLRSSTHSGGRPAMADNEGMIGVGDIVRYKYGRVLYAVTAAAEDNVTLIDLAAGAPWGTVLRYPLVLVASYDELYERRRADG